MDFFIIIFLINLLLNKIQCKNYDPLLKLSRIDRSAGKTQFAKEYVKDILFDVFNKLPNIECIPNSYYFNRSCYYFSKDSQKFTWLHAEKFCRKLPLNASLLVIKTIEEYDFIREKLIEIREIENYRDQLVFNIGFNHSQGEWRWINNSTFNNNNTNGVITNSNWNDWSASLGHCGTIVGKDNKEVILRSAPCHRTDERFICTYLLNACLNNTVCGEYGRCINLITTIRCDCTSVFYEGKYCDKLNNRAIQTIAGVGIVIFFVVYLSITGKCVRSCLEKCSTEAKKSIRKRKENLNDKDNHETIVLRPKLDNHEKSTAKNKLIETFSSKFKKHLKKNMKYYDRFCVVLIVIFLTNLQILLIHIFKQSFKKTLISNIDRGNNTLIHRVCSQFERKFLSEEAICLPFAMILLVLLVLTRRTKRFSNHIMLKYKHFLNTIFYKNIIKKYEKQRKEKEKKRLDEMKCFKRFKYKTTHSCFYKFLCCFCCCSCCTQPQTNEDEKNDHGCCYNTCCLPILETDCCKVMIMIKNILRCILLIDLWCCIRRKIIKKIDEKKKANNEKSDNKEDANDENSDDKKDKNDEKSDDQDEIDDDDSLETSKFKFSWPLPLLPYSTTNRLLSAAVYVAYTYDIINIFMYLNTSYLVLPVIPIISEKDGVLKDFLIQILQVILIGFKFYPILAIADVEPHLITYSASFLYILTLWILKIFNKGLCSRTEAFVKFSIEKVENTLHQSKLKRINDRFNITQKLGIDLNGDDDGTEESKYSRIIHDKIPKLFDKVFGSKPRINDEFNSDLLTTTSSPILTMIITKHPNSTMSNLGFRKKFLNKTSKYIGDLMDDWNNEEPDWSTTVRNLLENLPLYICLSYLLAKFFLSSIHLIVDSCKSCAYRCKDNCCKSKTENDCDVSKNLINTIELIQENNNNNNKPNNHACNIYGKKYRVKKHRIENHNYDYLIRLIKNIRINKCLDEKCKTHLNPVQRTLSFTLTLLYKIYKPVGYFRFSKQFINTYMVAFMIIYFFTVFILRASSVFGDWMKRGIELIYKLILTTGLVTDYDIGKHDLNTEFTVACLMTSLISFVQLLLSIKAFQSYVLFLHKGGDIAYKGLSPNPKKSDLFVDLFNLNSDQEKIKSKLNINQMVASHSLHYPGYLVAHLVYSYIIIFCVLFIIILALKIFFYLPQALPFFSQIFLPIIIILMLRILGLKFLTRCCLFQKTSNTRLFMSNLTSYYILSYFNFFFDCILGFVACMNRVWQTTIISLFYLQRLDETMYNNKKKLLLQQLDKGHLAYMNFVHMEHLYNNPVLICFGEVMVETLFFSYMRSAHLEERAEGKGKQTNSIEFKRKMSKVCVKFNCCGVARTNETIIENENENDEIEIESNDFIKIENINFKYESYRRLCNIFYLYILLKQNPILSNFTTYNVIKEKIKSRKREITNESLRDSFVRHKNRLSKSSSGSSDNENKRNSNNSLKFENSKRQSDLDDDITDNDDFCCHESDDPDTSYRKAMRQISDMPN